MRTPLEEVIEKIQSLYTEHREGKVKEEDMRNEISRNIREYGKLCLLRGFQLNWSYTKIDPEECIDYIDEPFYWEH